MKSIRMIGCIICFCSFFVGCHTEQKTRRIETDDNLQIINIDDVKKEDRILYSELFSHVKTIILETNNDVLLGKIGGIQVYNDLIFILDKQQNIGVYVFNKEGRFIRKIGKRGLGPGEYLKISDFTIDRENENIYLLDCEVNRIFKYKFTGEYQSVVALENANIQSFHLQYSNGRLYTDINYIDGTKNGYMIREIDPSSGKQKACWLDPGKYNRNWKGLLQRGSESLFYARNQDSFKFVHYFMNTIISFHDGHIEQAFLLEDKDWIMQKEVVQIERERDKNGGMITFSSIENQDIAFNINNYMEWGDFVSFQYQKNDNQFFVLHNIKTNTTRYTPLLIDDLVFQKPMLAYEFGCADSNGLYGFVNTDRLMRVREEIRNGYFLNPNLDKVEELKNLPEDSNPVIFYYEY